MIPLNFAVTFYIERNFVNPFLEARGAWAAVTQFMLIFFTLLDLGTSQAMVKYFAEYRLNDPGRAITYAQFFIWFHALAGMFQITALGLAAAAWLPHTTVAFLAWFVVLHTLIQFPGFISIFFNLFRALQRFDYAQLLIVLTYVLNPAVQMICGIYMRHWGLMHPVFGEGMGVVFGFAIGGVFANLLMGMFCSIFYEKMGFKLGTIFLAHFDRATINKSIVYGAKLTGGQARRRDQLGIGAGVHGASAAQLSRAQRNFAAHLRVLLRLSRNRRVHLHHADAVDIGELLASHDGADAPLPRPGPAMGHHGDLDARRDVHCVLRRFHQRPAATAIRARRDRHVADASVAAADFTTRLPDQVFQGVGRTGTFTWTSLLEHVQPRHPRPGIFCSGTASTASSTPS